MIHYYYGYGKGKTCSAVGAAMRAYGAGMSVLFVQFFKNDQSSELSALPFEVYPSPHNLGFNPGDEYKVWVDGALDYIKNSSADVVVLDESSDLIPKFLTVDGMKKLLSSDREYIITGHNKVSELYDLADYATFFQKEKHPYDKGVAARHGIEY